MNSGRAQRTTRALPFTCCTFMLMGALLHTGRRKEAGTKEGGHAQGRERRERKGKRGDISRRAKKKERKKWKMEGWKREMIVG